MILCGGNYGIINLILCYGIINLSYFVCLYITQQQEEEIQPHCTVGERINIEYHNIIQEN